MVTFIITCDGGSFGNNSKDVVSNGYGSFNITMPNHDHGNSITIAKEYGDGITNNEAEYMSLIDGMNHIINSFFSVSASLKKIAIIVRTDSQLVIGQLSKGWKIKAANLRPLAIKANSLMQEFGQVSFEQISGIEMKQILGH
jgi:ribonuclease HI